jgi:hypothetical protein
VKQHQQHVYSFIHKRKKERDKMVEREREAKEERGSISYSFPFFFLRFDCIWLVAAFHL